MPRTFVLLIAQLPTYNWEPFDSDKSSLFDIHHGSTRVFGAVFIIFLSHSSWRVTRDTTFVILLKCLFRSAPPPLEFLTIKRTIFLIFHQLFTIIISVQHSFSSNLCTHVIPVQDVSCCVHPPSVTTFSQFTHRLKHVFF